MKAIPVKQGTNNFNGITYNTSTLERALLL